MSDAEMEEFIEHIQSILTRHGVRDEHLTDLTIKLFEKLIARPDADGNHVATAAIIRQFLRDDVARAVAAQNRAAPPPVR
jgi:hypothetical protein